MKSGEPETNGRPPRGAFTAEEWEIIASHRTPLQVQRYLTAMPYNWERNGATLRSFRGVVSYNEAHCLEAALAAAVILEQHGYPPLLLDLESQDELDHVVFIYQKKGLWGSVARSRDVGLHGRRPVFRQVRHLAWSYFDPFVDHTGRLTGYGVTSLYDLGRYDWRLKTGNVSQVEQHLREMPHHHLRSSDKRYRKLLARYKEFRRLHPKESPAYFANRDLWVR